MRPARPLVGHDGRPVARFHTEKAIEPAGRASPSSSTTRLALASEAAAGERLGRRRGRCPRLRAAADAARPALGGLRDAPPRRRPAGVRGRGPARARSCSPRRWSTRSARPSVTTDSDRGRRRAGVRGRPGRDGPDRPGDLAGLARGEPRRRTTTARPSGPSSTRSPSSTRAGTAILDFCRAELARIEAFCRERDLIGLADEPLEIRWTPVFLRSFGGAMLDSPGPLDRARRRSSRSRRSPTTGPPEQAESYLREDNDRMLRLLTIHEAVPGPLPPGRLREPLPLDRPERSSGAASSPRAGPSTSPR